MSLGYIQQYYGVPAELGRKVTYNGKPGVIVGATHQYLKIHFDGERKPHGVYHPTSGIEYFGMGKMPKVSPGSARWARYQDIGECFNSFRDFLGYLQTEKQAHSLGFSTVSEYEQYMCQHS